MAGVDDYSTNADLNTTAGGVFIGELCPAANLNNGIRAVMADLAAKVASGELKAATAAEILAAAASARQLNTANIKVVNTPIIIGDASTVNFDFSTGRRFRITKTQNGSFTFSNAIVGFDYDIFVTQDGTGGRTATLTAPTGVTLKYRGTYPGLSAGANVMDHIHIDVLSATEWKMDVVKGYGG